MALPYVPNNWDAAATPTKRAVSHKRSTRSGFPFQHLGVWQAAAVSPKASSPGVYSTAEPSSLDDSDVSSSSDTILAQHPPHLSTYTPFSICLDRPFRTVGSARYIMSWPTPDRTDCRSNSSRCSSILSTGREANSVVRLPSRAPGKAKESEQEAQGGRMSSASGVAEHGLDAFKCHYCEKGFATKPALRHHAISHDPVRAHKYHCTTCQRGFRYPKDLKRHSSTHRQANEPGEYPCPLCDKTFSRRDNLRRHQRLNLHSQPSEPADVIGNPGAREALRYAKKDYTNHVEEPACDHDQDHQSRGHAGSNVPTAGPPTDSRTLPVRSGPRKPSTKRTRKSSSDNGEDSSGDGPGRKKPREPVKLGWLILCPFVGCPVERRGGISKLLRHIKQVHLVDICINCLKRIAVHQEKGCQKICASPSCSNKTGDSDQYHISRNGCVKQRRDEVTMVKYGLVCEVLGLPMKFSVPNCQPRCHGCQTKDEALVILNLDSQNKEKTIASLTLDCQLKDATIKALSANMSNSIGPSQTLPAQRNTAEPFDFTSGPYTGLTFPVANQNGFLGQERPYPTSAPPQSLYMAPNSSARQATQPGSFTQPSFRATNSTYMSRRETHTEPSEAVHDSNAEMSTTKPFDMNDFVNDDYDLLPPFDNNSALYGAGGQFNRF